MTPPVLSLGSDPLANVNVLLGALVRETYAADAGSIGHHLSDALSRIQVWADNASGLLAVALDLDEADADDLTRERRNWLRVVGVFPVLNVGAAS